MVGGAAGSAGKKFDVEERMKARIEAAGFVNIREKLYKCPIGEWAKNPIPKEAGKFNKLQTEQGMEGVSNIESSKKYFELTGDSMRCSCLLSSAYHSH